MFKSIKSAIGKVWRPVETSLDVVEVTANLLDDTVKTYGNEVLISNAEVRNDQMKSLESLDRVVTNEQISLVLAGKVATDEEVVKETNREVA